MRGGALAASVKASLAENMHPLNDSIERVLCVWLSVVPVHAMSCLPVCTVCR